MFGLMGLRGSSGLGLDTVAVMAALVVDWKMVDRAYKVNEVWMELSERYPSRVRMRGREGDRKSETKRGRTETEKHHI